ncbi:MAG: transglutaminase-like domain-containing protein [Deltaproteobacteria bacterium]|nr:transglutaminase-like domain-containing protein [Deltaproteobacteria bacterium]
MKRKEHYFGLALIISTLLFYILTLPGCAPTKVKTYPRETRTEITSPGRPIAGKTYAEAISQWKSHQDLVEWMERDFSLDMERYKRFKGTLPIPRTPEETFQLKSGIYIDAAEFSKKTLNQINPSYRAQTVVILVRPNVFNHYVCAFRKDGKLFVLDYGTPYKEITGVHGPYSSLDEYKRFYEKHHPEKRRVEGIVFLK